MFIRRRLDDDGARFDIDRIRRRHERDRSFRRDRWHDG